MAPTPCLALAAAAALAATPSLATPRGATASDAPVALALATPSARLLAPDGVSAPGGTAAAAPAAPRYVPHFGVTFAAAFLAVPAGLALTNVLGTLSISLLWAAVPGLLAMGLVAPTLTALVAWLYGNWGFLGRADKPFGFWRPWAAAMLVNVVSLVIAGFLGVSVGVPATVFTFGVVEGLALAGATVGTMHALEKKAPATVPLASVAF